MSMLKETFITILMFVSVTVAAAADGQKAIIENQTSLPRIRFEKVFSIEHPTFAVHDPTGRMFFVEQRGRIRLFENGKLEDTPYLDISKKTFLEYENGLLSIAFHPRFAENGLFYAYYVTNTAPKPPPSTQPATRRGRRGLSVPIELRSMIVEYRVDPKARQVDDSSERVVLTLDQPMTLHKGGQIEFGPDGYLYIGFGDGGPQGDARHMGQNLNTFFAKMLRIDVTPRVGYAIPADNPLVGKEGCKPEIFAWGLRNPWRFSFDRGSNVLFCADVGLEAWEEVDLIVKGGNYGWSLREGAHDYHPDQGSPAPSMIDPIFEYNHERTAACIIGGYVYHGKRIPELAGWYLCGDYSQGFFYALKVENGKLIASGKFVDPRDATRKAGLKNPSQPASFGVDAEGEHWMLDANGPVYRIVADTVQPASSAK